MEPLNFSFEGLEVWQESVEFAKSILEISETIQLKTKHFRLIEQLESSSTSVALNIAEGKGRYSKKEFIHFLYVARGSLYETLTLLIILNRYNLIGKEQLLGLKLNAGKIGKMLCGLINSLKHSINFHHEP